MKLWGGRFEKETDKSVDAFSTSIHQDHAMWEADIIASIAHVQMLADQKILSNADGSLIVEGLQSLGEDLRSGKLQIDFACEDIHSFIEIELGKRVGDVSKKMHAARSRNDQVATDTRLFLAGEIKKIMELIRGVQKELLAHAEKEINTVLPGSTHMQHAQPVSLAHHVLAYFWMLSRDRERLQDSLKRVLSLPLGSAALAGTGFNIDRENVREKLKFEKISENSLDSVSDRDFVIEFLSDVSLVMMHLSRFSEELILWSTPEYSYVELGDEVTTGSSIMPQKKNPDVAELIRGKVGRVYGSLMGALTMMKGLPMSYNRDMQEDKFHLLEGIQTTSECLQMTALMLQKIEWKRENMAFALAGDFSNATDLADDLVLKGLSFREAHEIVGNMVRACIQQQKGLENLTLDELKKFHPLFDEVTFKKIPHTAVLNARTSAGGTSPAAVLEQIKKAKTVL